MNQLLEARSARSRQSQPLIRVPLANHGGQIEYVGDDLVRASSTRHEVVLHGVLYDRAELHRELGFAEPHDRNDAALVLGALTRWGPEAPQHLRGDFFYVIKDRLVGSITLVRDHLGIHPCFYATTATQLLISTSCPALVSQAGVSRDLNRLALADHLRYRWPDPEETYFEAVRRVPRGSLVYFHDGQRAVRRYWNVAPIDVREPGQPE